ncbi:sensor histidine kinase [Nocardioides terrisoli]|uniref:sensor histidine kinase n=1 Tax=Nocardioides terrisoli TaxID=3388267 RepID=UPI00287B6CFB|nr:sensor histidine kinase [Nocardioides marmorisolisilvae]
MARRSSPIARQVLLLQALVVLVVVVAAVVLAFVEARSSQLDSARLRSVDVAESVADAPTVLRALGRPDPSRTIQPYAERVRRDTGTDFVVVMALDRTRYSHPDPKRIGQHFIGDLGGAPQGRVFTEEHTGTLGPSMRAVVPVFDRSRVVALVSVGITLKKVDRALREQVIGIGLAGLVVLGLGAGGTWLIGRRLRRQTHGLGAAEITRMYEYYQSVLHAVREGLLLLDQEGRVVLANDEAVRLLALPAAAAGLRVDALGLPDRLSASLLAGTAGPDELHLVGDFVLVVNQARADAAGRGLGSVVTLRDHTELRAVSGELDTAKGLAESLRSQNHEAANRLHTVVSLIEMGRPEDALDFATAELRTAQLLTDHVVGAVQEPVVAALLLGKTAQAAERGVDLVLGPDSSVRGLPIEGRELVTLLGNLVDNALDAVAESSTRRVEVALHATDAQLDVRVEDSGPGLAEDAVARAFERGWSTKSGDPAMGRGLGLALVARTVRRHHGSVDVSRSALGGASFTVRIPAR